MWSKSICILGGMLLAAFNLFAVNINGLSFSKGSYELYEKAEATFSLDIGYSNPHDPDIIQVDAEVTLPSSGTVLVPCFYYIPVTFTGSPTTGATENAGGATWMLRYTPEETGVHTIRIRAIDGTGTYYSGNVNFTATASTKKGFIKINPTNDQFTTFDDGTPYYPVGFNLTWNDGTLIDFYRYYFGNMAPNNINWFRYWLTDFARQSLEWTNDPGYWGGWHTGLGNYNQRASALVDSILNLCNQNNMYMQFVLQHHGQFSTTTNAEWNPSGGNPGNSYNSVNGGPVANAGDYFNNAAAKAQAKKQYRYIVARWGYSTNVYAWELFNEVNFTDGNDNDIDDWHDEMSLYIESIDPFDHIITTSSTEAQLTLMDDNTAMDQLQFHRYASIIDEAVYGEAQHLMSILNTPIWCGEFGTPGSYVGHPDNWGDHVRKTMWKGMFSESPAMHWYWDDYVDDKNMYALFKPLADYLDGEDIVTNTGGNGILFNWQNNPIYSGPIAASGGMGWGTSTQNSFIVEPDGTINGLENLSTFLYGDWKAAMGREASFTVDFAAAGTAEIDINTIAANGPHTLEISVDGGAPTVFNACAGCTHSVPVTAGTHTIRFYMAGIDWIEVSTYRFDPVSVNSLKAYGYVGNTTAYGYVNDQTYGEWSDPVAVSTISGAEIKVGPLDAGNYDVEIWDPKDGNVVSLGSYSTTDDTITFMLPDFKKDLAFKVSGGSLPVDLLSFNGHFSNHHTILNWTTSSEKDNAYFDIQRSSDGTTYKSIGTVNGNGTISTLTDYQFTDYSPFTGINYYRLKQVDTDGDYAYSNVVTINNQNTTASVYPNPTSGELFLQVNNKQANNTHIQIIDLLGKVHLEKSVALTKGGNQLHLNVAHLSDGIYFIALTKKDGSKSTVKFIKH